MEDFNEMPASQANGDSGSEAGLIVEQKDFTLIALKDYNILDREELLQCIYENKNGKRDTQSSYGMYIEIPTTYPIDLQSFSACFVQELSKSVNLFSAYGWSENFGRVFVGVSDKSTENKTPVRFMRADDTDALRYKQVLSGKTIDPSELVSRESLKGGRHLIMLNNSDTSIEGLLINVTHMLDELIWNLAKTDGKRTASSYKDAIQNVKKNGVRFKFASEDEIVTSYLNDIDNTVVRLYGSRKSKTVPFVLGCVVPDAFTEVKKLDEIDNNIEYENTKAAEMLDVNSYEVTIGVTTAKEVHAGHLLLFLTANSFAKCIDTTVTISANNTGPRVYATVSKLKKDIESLTGKEITTEQAIEMLSVLPLSVTQRLYQSRDEESISSSDSVVPTLRFATEQNMSLFRLLGLNVNYILDTDCNPSSAINYAFQNSPGYFPEMGLGFTSLQSGKNVSYMDRNEITATGASIANILNLAIKDDELKGVAYFDHESSTSIAAKVITEQLGIPAYQPSGAAIGFGGEIASGTKGNSIRLNEIYNTLVSYGEQLDIDNEEIVRIGMNALTFGLFTNYYISDLHPNDYNANTFYDYSDKPFFFSALFNQINSYIQIQKELSSILNILEDDKLIDSSQNNSKNQNALVARSEAISRMTPEKLLQVIGSQSVLKANKVDIQIFEDMGYSESEAIKKVEEVQSGNLLVCKRSHPYVEYIKFLLSTDKNDLEYLDNKQKESVKNAILTVRKLFS